jgi:hypothetical protein
MSADDRRLCLFLAFLVALWSGQWLVAFLIFCAAPQGRPRS